MAGRGAANEPGWAAAHPGAGERQRPGAKLGVPGGHRVSSGAGVDQRAHVAAGGGRPVRPVRDGMVGIYNLKGDRPMADFFQHGLIATIHDLGTIQRERIERMLERFAVNCRVGLVLPVTAGDMRRIRLPRSWRNWFPSVTFSRSLSPSGWRPRRTITAKPSAKFACWGTAPLAVDGRPTRAGLVPAVERRRLDGVDAGQGPIGMDRVRIPAGRPAAGGLCPARLRHRQLRPRNARPAVPAHRPSQHGFRVLQSLLRAGHRSHARPCRAAARFASAARLDLAAGVRPIPGLLG